MKPLENLKETRAERPNENERDQLSTSTALQHQDQLLLQQLNSCLTITAGLIRLHLFSSGESCDTITGAGNFN